MDVASLSRVAAAPAIHPNIAISLATTPETVPAAAAYGSSTSAAASAFHPAFAEGEHERRRCAQETKKWHEAPGPLGRALPDDGVRSGAAPRRRGDPRRREGV